MVIYMYLSSSLDGQRAEINNEVQTEVHGEGSIVYRAVQVQLLVHQRATSSVYTCSAQIWSRLFSSSQSSLDCGPKDDSVFLSLEEITCQHKK